MGFYSGYIVADRITVESRRAGVAITEGVRWSSEGTGDFEVETITRETRGTDVILHIREGEDEFLSTWKLKSIISKYSDHISLPVLMRKESWDAEKGENVVFPFACANRDSEVFDDSLVFDMHRKNNRHIAFGAGIHRCVGSHLARVELYAALAEFHRVVPTYRLAENADLEDYVVGVSGPKEVPLIFAGDP